MLGRKKGGRGSGRVVGNGRIAKNLDEWGEWEEMGGMGGIGKD